MYRVDQSNAFSYCFLLSQYEELNSMGMLLTDSQRKWVTFLKEAARKKPPTTQIRPQVSGAWQFLFVVSFFSH